MNEMSFYNKMILHSDFKELKSFMHRLPSIFTQEGTYIYKGRNELKVFEEEGYQLVVKSYKRPNILNKLIYSFIRSSKAERAYYNALKFIEAGIGTPKPVGFIVQRKGLLISNSYLVTLRSDCPSSFKDFRTRSFDREEAILEAIAKTTARIHNQGFLHKDYSSGNILFDESKDVIPVEIIDLNRMRFGFVSMKKGCKNFERLPATESMFETMGFTYAKERDFDPSDCIESIKMARKKEAIRSHEEL